MSGRGGLPAHLERLIAETGETPVLNQVAGLLARASRGRATDA